jgi:rhamnose transport system permease protein
MSRIHHIATHALRWESVLGAAILVVLAVNTLSSPYFLNAQTLADATFNFTEKGLVALPMALLMIAGDIDISVAAIMALCSIAMGYGALAVWPPSALVTASLAVGIACGACNGWLVTACRVPALVATIGTMSLFRGIAYGVLGDQTLKNYPRGFEFFGQGYVAGVISLELVLLIVAALLSAILLHRTVIGRRIYAIGANITASRMSGIAVNGYRFWLFAATGAASGLASVLLTSRLSSTRPTLAAGWELEIITIVILGGVSVNGGRGTILGVMLAAILLGLLTFGLGMHNIPGIVMSMIIGIVLIMIVAIPNLAGRLEKFRNSAIDHS